jgi:hypothetical protein
VSGGFEQAYVDALAALERALKQTGAAHMVIGGLAVIARGVIRHTDDIDATVWAPDTNVAALIEALRNEGIVGRVSDVEAFAARSQVLLLVHAATGVEMDVSLAWLPFERAALDRADTIKVQGMEAPFAVVDDLVVYKAVAWRDTDKSDITALLRLHRSSVNLTEIRERVAEFAQALEEPQRVTEFERLVTRALAGAKE